MTCCHAPVIDHNEQITAALETITAETSSLSQLVHCSNINSLYSIAIESTLCTTSTHNLVLMGITCAVMACGLTLMATIAAFSLYRQAAVTSHTHHVDNHDNASSVVDSLARLITPRQRRPPP